MADVNGQNGTVPGAVRAISQSLISALPPAFLLLCLINVAFIGTVLWFLDDQLDQRTVLVGKLVDHCMANVGKMESLGALEARLDGLEHDVRALETQRKQP